MPKKNAKANHGALDSALLISFIERLENLHAQHNDINHDMSEIYAEAKSQGYDPKFIKKMIKLRAKDPDQLAEEQALMEMYCKACGVQLLLDL